MAWGLRQTEAEDSWFEMGGNTDGCAVPGVAGYTSHYHSKHG